MKASPAEAARLAARLDRLRAALREADLGALVVSHLPNIRYLTNFDGTAAVVVVTAAHLYLITDFRYSSAVEAIASSAVGSPGMQLVLATGTYDESLAGILNGLPSARIGIEGAHMSVAQFRRLEAALAEAGPGAAASDAAATSPRLLCPVDDLVEQGRLVKDDYEVSLLRAAGRRLSELARERLRGVVAAGRTEREIAADIDDALRRGGFEKPAFETIVASGPNGARPHARPSERTLQSGDLVVLDFGGVYGGYHVDLTRTVSIGDPSPACRRLYEAVREAQDAALSAIRPGVPASVVDATARDLLRERGYGEAFGHATGHGLGLEVHEAPRIGQPAAGRADEVLQTGMVFTVEPGAYVPGVGGVRIEDDVLVGPDGHELLTDVPRTLAVL